MDEGGGVGRGGLVGWGGEAALEVGHRVSPDGSRDQTSQLRRELVTFYCCGHWSRSLFLSLSDLLSSTVMTLCFVLASKCLSLFAFSIMTLNALKVKLKYFCLWFTALCILLSQREVA